MTINYYAPFGDGTYWRNITDLDDTTYGQIAVIDGKRKLVVGDKIGELCLVGGKRRYWVEVGCSPASAEYIIFNGLRYDYAGLGTGNAEGLVIYVNSYSSSGGVYRGDVIICSSAPGTVKWIRFNAVRSFGDLTNVAIYAINESCEMSPIFTQAWTCSGSLCSMSTGGAPSTPVFYGTVDSTFQSNWYNAEYQCGACTIPYVVIP